MYGLNPNKWNSGVTRTHKDFIINCDQNYIINYICHVQRWLQLGSYLSLINIVFQYFITANSSPKCIVKSRINTWIYCILYSWLELKWNQMVHGDLGPRLQTVDSREVFYTNLHNTTLPYSGWKDRHRGEGPDHPLDSRLAISLTTWALSASNCSSSATRTNNSWHAAKLQIQLPSLSFHFYITLPSLTIFKKYRSRV